MASMIVIRLFRSDDGLLTRDFGLNNAGENKKNDHSAFHNNQVNS